MNKQQTAAERRRNAARIKRLKQKRRRKMIRMFLMIPFPKCIWRAVCFCCHGSFYKRASVSADERSFGKCKYGQLKCFAIINNVL